MVGAGRVTRRVVAVAVVREVPAGTGSATAANHVDRAHGNASMSSGGGVVTRLRPAVRPGASSWTAGTSASDVWTRETVTLLAAISAGNPVHVSWIGDTAGPLTRNHADPCNSFAPGAFRSVVRLSATVGDACRTSTRCGGAGVAPAMRACGSPRLSHAAMGIAPTTQVDPASGPSADKNKQENTLWAGSARRTVRSQPSSTTELAGTDSDSVAGQERRRSNALVR